MTKELTFDSVREILGALGEILASDSHPCEIVVIGGSALILAGLAPDTRTTKDVDVVAVGAPGQMKTADPLPAELAEAAQRVAQTFDLRSDWLNGEPTTQLVEGLPPGFEKGMAVYKFGGLTVRVPSRSALVALKVHAALDSSRGNKHEEDLSSIPNLDHAELVEATNWAVDVRRRSPKDRAAELIERLVSRK